MKRVVIEIVWDTEEVAEDMGQKVAEQLWEALGKATSITWMTEIEGEIKAKRKGGITTIRVP